MSFRLCLATKSLNIFSAEQSLAKATLLCYTREKMTKTGSKVDKAKAGIVNIV